MRGRSVLGIAVAVALVAGSDCQRQATRVSSFGLEPRSMTVPSAMGPLIPADAVGLLYLASIDEAEKSLRELHAGSKGDSSRIDIAGKIAGRLHIPADAIDRTRPAAVALSLVNLGRTIPLPTFILPVRNEREVMQQLRARRGLPEPLANRGWIGVPLMAGYARGTGIPPLAKDLPAGVIAVRLRTDRVLETVQPILDVGIQAMLQKMAQKEAGTDSAKARLRVMQAHVAAAVARQALDFLRGTETIDCAIRTQGSNLGLAYRALTTPESRDVAATAERARGLADLARCLPADYPFMGLVAMDFAKPVAFYKNLYSGVMNESMQEVPESLRDYTRSMMERSLELYQLTDDRMFHAMRFGDAGAEVIQVFATQEPAKFIDMCRKLLGFELLESAGLGTVEPEEPVVVDGVEVQGVRVRLNFEQLVKLQRSSGHAAADSVLTRDFSKRFLESFAGGEAMVVRFAAVGNQVVVVTHPDRAVIAGCIAALKQNGGRVPPSLREVQRLAKDPLCFWARADLRDILLPMLEAMHPEASSAEVVEMRRRLEALDPSPVTAYMTAGRRAYAGALSLNADSFAALAKAMGHGTARRDSVEAPKGSKR